MSLNDADNYIEVINVLHVDDDKNQLQFLKMFLTNMEEKIRVTSTSSPDEALKILFSNNFDCVVTDFSMPRINGIDLAKKIRENSSVPIIIYTGQGSEEVAEAAFLVGIDDYLRKEPDPSHYKVLIKRILNVVEKKRTEILYQSVVEQTMDALTITIGTTILFANQAMADLVGVINPNQLIGKNAMDLIHDSDKEMANQMMHDYLDGKGKQSFYKYKIKKSNGKISPVETSASVITYKGKPAFLTFIRDVSEREKLENERNKSDRRLRTLFELAPDGIATVNMKGVVTSVNPAFCRLTGYKAEEIVGSAFFNMASMQKSDVKRNVKIFLNIVRGKLPPHTEFIFNHKNGKAGLGEAHLAFIEFDNQTELLAILRDVTQRSSIEKNQKELNTQIQMLVDAKYQEVAEAERKKIVEDMSRLVEKDIMLAIKEIKKAVSIGKSQPERTDEVYRYIDDVVDITSSRLINMVRQMNITEDQILTEEDLNIKKTSIKTE